MSKKKSSGKRKIKTGSPLYLDHPMLVLLCIALAAMSWLGSAGVQALSVVSVIICFALFFKKEIIVDIWSLAAMGVFLLCCLRSSWAALGNPAYGYSANFMFYPPLYLALCSLSQDEGARLRRFGVFWAELLSALGILHYISLSWTGSAGRLGFILGNPNMLGIYLVMAWLLLQRLEDEEASGGIKAGFLLKAEPALVCALVLTLSMGSFLSFALALLCRLVSKSRKSSFKTAFSQLAGTCARLAVFALPGLAMYISDRNGLPLLCTIFAILSLVLCVFRGRIRNFLARPKIALPAVLILGIPAAAAAVILRPTASDTFGERLKMMQNAFGYFKANPLFGVGVYQWQQLNKLDSDMYFHTYHIHNALLHFGAELGIFAVLAIIILAVRFWMNRENRPARSLMTAFYLHCLIDVTVFHMSPVTLFMIGCNSSGGGKLRLSKLAVRIISAVFLIYFLYAFLVRI
ncbi:MAG: O-antigen ligase family protein [Candidatus Limivicinus sp.]|jgi:hypothetical protein